MARAKRSFRPAPEGIHRAVLVDAIERGLKATPSGQLVPKVELRWQINAIDPDSNDRFQVRQWYTLSLHEKAKLRGHLEGILGKKFTPKDALKGVDLEQLIGTNAKIRVAHNVGKYGITYANIEKIVPLPDGVAVLKAQHYTREQDRADNGTALEEASETENEDEDRDEDRDEDHDGDQEDLGI